MKLFLTSLLFTLALSAWAQDNTSNWQIKWAQNEVKVGETAELIISCSIKEDWYMYASDFDPNLGPVVTELDLNKNSTFSVVGNLVSYKRKEKYDSLWGGKISYFTGKAEYRVKIKILHDKPVIKGVLRYQVCSDKEGRCIPGSYTLAVPSIKVLPGTTDKKPADVSKSTTTPSVQTPNQDKLKQLEEQKKSTDNAIPYLRKFLAKYGAK